MTMSGRLADAAMPRASLWAFCMCGRQAPLDPRPWLGQGLARLPLSALEERVRCGCGARWARLEVRALSVAPAATDGPYAFR
jgi:hypothetical protein